MDAAKEAWKDPKKKHKIIMGASALFSFVMSIYSFVNCFEANVLLQENAVDYTNVILNWEAKPLLDATVVPKNSTCPTGYEEGTGFATEKNSYKEDKSANTLQTVAVWPGTERCVCEGQTYSSGRPYIEKVKKKVGCTGGTKCTSTSSSGCSSQQLKDGCKHKYEFTEKAQVMLKDIDGKCDLERKRAGCVTESVPEKNLLSFKGNKVCYQRGGKSAFDRPQPENSKCPGGTFECGDAKSSGIYCAEKESDCPVTS